MRVELIYKPGCNSYRKALHALEMVIAEERLPLPIELVEETSKQDEPEIRIDGESILTCVDSLRDSISNRWIEMAVSPLLRGY